MKKILLIGLCMLLLIPIANGLSIINHWPMNDSDWLDIVGDDSLEVVGNVVLNNTVGVMLPNMIGAAHFDGADDQLRNLSIGDLTADGSISMWVWFDDVAAERTVYERDAGASINHEIYTVAGDVIRHRTWTGEAAEDLDYTPQEKEGWYHFVLSWGSAGQFFYVNKTGINDTAFTGNGAASDDIHFGARKDNTFEHKGLVADVRLYDAALTQAEINTLFDDMTFTPDTNPPVITNFASNATNSTATGDNVSLEAVCTDDIAAGQIWYEKFNETQFINSSSVDYVNGVIYTFNITIDEAAELDVNLSIYCNDTSANIAHSELIGFTVQQADIRAPFSLNNESNNASDDTKFGQNVNFSVTVGDDIGLDCAIFSSNDTGPWVNGTSCEFDMGGATRFFLEKSLAQQGTRDEVVCGRFHINDTSGLENVTADSCFTVNNTQPTISNPLKPNDGTHNFTNVNLTCSTSTDADGDSIFYAIYFEKDDTDPDVKVQNTTSPFYTTVLNLDSSDDGSYFWKCISDDGFNTQDNGTTSKYVLDTVTPVIIINFPGTSNTTASFNNTPTINVTVTDTNLDLTNVTGFCEDGTIIYTNETNWTVRTDVNLSDAIDFSSCGIGTHVVRVCARDTISSSPKLKHYGVETKGTKNKICDPNYCNYDEIKNDKKILNEEGVVDVEYKFKGNPLYEITAENNGKKISNSKIEIEFDEKHYKETYKILLTEDVRKYGLDLRITGENIRYIYDGVKGHFVIADMYYRHYDDVIEDITVLVPFDKKDEYTIHIDYSELKSITEMIDGKLYWIIDPITGGLNSDCQAVTYNVIKDTSVEHFDIEVNNVVINSPSYVLISNTSFNFTREATVIFKGGGQASKVTIDSSSTISMRIKVNDITRFDEAIRTVSDLNDTGVFTIPIFNVSATDGENNLTVEVKEDGAGAVNISNLEIHATTNLTVDNNNVEFILNDTNFEFSDTSFTNFKNFTLQKDFSSRTLLDVHHTFSTTGADTTPSCYFINSLNNERTIVYERYLSISADMGSSGVSHRSTVDSSGNEIWQLFCKSSDGDTIKNNVSVLIYDQIDSQRNNITGFGNTTEEALSVSGDDNKILSFENFENGNGTEVEIYATVLIQSTTGAQEGSSSPVIKLNSSNLPPENCSQTLQRSLSSNSDIGTVKFYAHCNNMTLGSTFTFNIFADVAAGETLSILNASLSGFVVETRDIEETNTPPIVTIIEPFVGTNLSGDVDVTYSVFDAQDDSFVVNATITNSSFSTLLAENLSKATTNFSFDSTAISDGLYNLTVTANENLTSQLFTGSDRIEVTIDNTNPSITNEVNRTILGSKEIHTNTSVQLNATVIDKNLVTVIVSHNDTGVWVNTTATSTETNIYNFTINKDNLNMSQTVGWFYWANDSAGNEANGNLQQFTVTNKPPSRPTLLIPPNDTTTGEVRPLFTWANGTVPPRQDGLQHSIVISKSADMSSPVINETVGQDFTPSIDLDGDETYFWHVYVNDSFGGFNISKDNTFFLQLTFDRGTGLINLTQSGQIIINSSFQINNTLPKYSTITDDKTLLVLSSKATELEDDFENRASSLAIWSIDTIIGTGNATSDVTEGLPDNHYQLNTTTDGVSATATEVRMYTNTSDMRQVLSGKMTVEALGGGDQDRAFIGLASFGLKQINTLEIRESGFISNNSIVELTINRTALDSDTWTIGNASTSFGTFSSSSLNDSLNWSIIFVASAKNGAAEDATTIFNIYNVNISAFALQNLTVKLNEDIIYTNNSVLLSNNTMFVKVEDDFQNCVDECTLPIGFECICNVNISAAINGNGNFSLNISYLPYQRSFQAGTVEELIPLAYGLVVGRLPNTTDLSGVSAAFEFRGEQFEADKTLFSDRFEFNITIIPQVNITGNYPHSWLFNMTFVNTTIDRFTTLNLTQKITSPAIGLCSNETTNETFFNLTFSDEQTIQLLDSNLDISFEGFFKSGVFSETPTGFNLSDINNISFCFDVNNSARYLITMNYDSTGFTPRIYNFLDNLTTLNPTLLPLYLSNNANITNIFITLFDENANRLPDFFVAIDRFYPGENEFREIERVRSDINGETVFNLVPLTIEYRIKIFNFQGDLVKIVAKTTIKSTDISITVPTGEGFFEGITNVDTAIKNSALSFDNATNEVVWQSNQQIFPQSCLAVTRLTGDGSLLYNNCQSDNVVVDSYTITENTTGNIYQFQGYYLNDKNQIISARNQEFNNLGQGIFGDAGLIITLLLTVTLFMLGIWKPSAAIALSVLGLLFSAWIGFVSLTIGSIIIIVIMSGYLIYKMRD